MKLLPSLKQLEYLTALAETLHFGRAADLCNVTPSTLSAGIRDLETVLGVPLAERTKRTVLMTPLGIRIAKNAGKLLCDAEQIMDLARSNDQPLSGDFRLGVIPTIGPFLLPRAVPQLHEKYPDLRLFLREEKTDQLLARLRSGEIDAALIALPFDIDGLAFEILFEDQFRFACLDDHVLANRKYVDQADIASQPLLLLEEGHCLRGHALSVCGFGQGQKTMGFEATSLHTLVQMVATGLGVTLVPQIAIDAGVSGCAEVRTGIRLIPLSDDCSRQIGLVWRLSSLRDAECKLLADELRKAQKTDQAVQV